MSLVVIFAYLAWFLVEAVILGTFGVGLVRTMKRRDGLDFYTGIMLFFVYLMLHVLVFGALGW